MKMQGEKQMVKSKARLRIKAVYEVKSKGMKGTVGPCRLRHSDDCIGCEVVGF